MGVKDTLRRHNMTTTQTSHLALDLMSETPSDCSGISRQR